MDKKISELDQAIQINNDAVFPMSQDNSGTDTTYKATITQLSTEIGEGQTFSNLQTTDKTLVGAINEVVQGGGGGGSSNANIAPDYDATSTYAVGDWCIYNGTLYQCNTAISVAEAFDPTHWTAKKVVDAFADIEDELDDKVDTADYTAELLPIQSGSATNTKDYIDTGLSGKADTSDTYTKSEVDTLVAGRKCSTYSLVTTSTLTGTETTFNTFSGRKFSDYDLYIFTFGESATYMRRTAIVTKSQWISGASVSEGVLHGSGSSSASAYSYCGMVISYNNDTSVKGKVLGSEAIDKFSIIGIKY